MSGAPSCARRGAAAAAWIGAAVAAVRLRERHPRLRPLAALGAVGSPVALALGIQRGKWRDAGVWALHMWAYKTLFELPHDRPWRHRRRVHVRYPIAIDTVIGAGVAPPQRLQAALRRPPAITWLDGLATVVYAAWDVEPHLALAWILIRHERRFVRAALRLGAVFDLTLLAYWLLPTAPPWWSSEVRGELGGAVQRVPVMVKRDLVGAPKEQGHETLGANPWASFPSDHLAAAAMVAMLVWEVDRRAGAAAWAYAGLLGAALVYLGEHYVLELIAGLALAELVRRAERTLRKAAGR